VLWVWVCGVFRVGGATCNLQEALLASTAVSRINPRRTPHSPTPAPPDTATRAWPTPRTCAASWSPPCAARSARLLRPMSSTGWVMSGPLRDQFGPFSAPPFGPLNTPFSDPTHPTLPHPIPPTQPNPQNRPPASPRPAAARSCAACCARSRQRRRTSSATPPRWRTLRWCSSWWSCGGSRGGGCRCGRARAWCVGLGLQPRVRSK